MLEQAVIFLIGLNIDKLKSEYQALNVPDIPPTGSSGAAYKISDFPYFASMPTSH